MVDSDLQTHRQAQASSSNRPRFLVLLLFILVIIIAEAFLHWIADINREDVLPSFASSSERLQSGYVQFFLLRMPSSLDIQAIPHGKDVDLYVTAGEDLKYFIKLIPDLEKFLSPSDKEVKNDDPKTWIYKLDPPQPWDFLAPPEMIEFNKSHLENVSATTYWSSSPTFTLSSFGLGVEKVHVPKAFKRPFLVAVFAPAGGFFVKSAGQPEDVEDSQYHYYTIRFNVLEKEIVSTYESVRTEAEKRSLSYDQLASMFSTLHEEDQQVPRRTSGSSYYPEKKETESTESEEGSQESGSKTESAERPSLAKYFLSELLEMLFDVII